MKRTINIFAAFLMLLYLILVSCNRYSVSEDQANSFIKYYPMDLSDNFASDIIQKLNGGYALLGNFEGSGISDGQGNIFFMTTDEFGRPDTQIPKTIGLAGNIAFSMIRVDDGFILTGSSMQENHISGYLVKLDQGGVVEWEKLYGGFQELEFHDLLETREGDLVMTGYCKTAAGDRDVIIFKTTSQGDSLWARAEGFAGFDDGGESILEFEDRYLIIGSSSALSPVVSNKILILNTNTEGRGISELRIEGENNLFGKDICLNSSGGINIMGNHENPFSGISELYVALITLEGFGNELINLEHQSFVKDSESVHGEAIISTPAEGTAISGWSNTGNDFDIIFLILDNSLTVQTRKNFGSKGYQAAHGITFSVDQGFALCGAVDLGGGLSSFLLKLDQDGELR